MRRATSAALPVAASPSLAFAGAPLVNSSSLAESQSRTQLVRIELAAPPRQFSTSQYRTTPSAIVPLLHRCFVVTALSSVAVAAATLRSIEILIKILVLPGTVFIRKSRDPR